MGVWLSICLCLPTLYGIFSTPSPTRLQLKRCHIYKIVSWRFCASFVFCRILSDFIFKQIVAHRYIVGAALYTANDYQRYSMHNASQRIMFSVAFQSFDVSKSARLCALPVVCHLLVYFLRFLQNITNNLCALVETCFFQAAVHIMYVMEEKGLHHAVIHIMCVLADSLCADVT